MRRRGTWTLLIVALVLAAAGALAPVAGAKPPKPAPPSTEAPATTKAPKAPKVTPPTTGPTATTVAPTTTTAPPPSTEPGFQVSATTASEPKVTVTPNRDLVHEQVVQVSGTGFGSGEGVNVVACPPDAATAFEGCDIGNFVHVDADQNGNWSTPFTVHLRLNNGRTNCGAEFGACVIAGTAGNNFSTDPSAPIGFDPDAIPDPPRVTVTPRTDLAHGQQVTVSGTGAAPDVVLLVGQCTLDDDGFPLCANDVGGFARADAEGTFELPVTVSVLYGFGYPGSPVTDCLVEQCVIRAVALDGLDNAGQTRITFDPDAPSPQRPTLTLTPDEDLVHDQTVRVTGSGFVPDTSVQVIECSRDRDPNAQCAYQFYGNVQADANGNIETTLTVRRVLGYAGQSVDCVDVGCHVRASSAVADPFKSVDVPIDFDPDAPLPPPPVVAITPARDLRHNDVLTVRGTGFSRDTDVYINECARLDDGGEDPSYGGCSYSDNNVATDSNGNFTTTFTVKRVIGFRGETAISDCLEDARCVLQVYAGEDPLTGYAELQLDFDRDAPLPPPPVLTVTPHEDLGGRELVRVHGEGFAPDSEHELAQCLDDNGPLDPQPCTSATSVRTDGEGKIDTTFLTRRFLMGIEGAIDCAIQPEPCVLVMSAFDDVLSRASARVTFDPDAPLPPRPSITVTPSTGLVEGAVVTVTGRDFVPNAGVTLSQCRGSEPSGFSCDPSILSFLRSDDQGSFTTEYTVRPGLLLPDGIVGCYDAPGACTIQAVTFGELDGVSNAVPLSFGPSVTPPAGGGSGGNGAGTTSTPVRTQSTPGLAATGTPVRGYLEFAAIFLGLGTLLVLASRRRRLWG